MQFGTLAQLAVLMGVASAFPAPATPLNFDDVILLGDDGGHKLIKESEYQEIAARGLLVPAPAPFALEARTNTDTNTNSHNKRCDESEEVQILEDDSFLNWDVAVSSVISAMGGTATVGVLKGYSVSNAVSVGTGATATIMEVLAIKMEVSYTETWTTTETSTLTYTVPANQYGLIVSQPMVRRVSGNYLTGCQDSFKSTTFTSDTYSSQSYGDLSWVTGVLRLCNSTEYPVPFCIGTGFHS